MKKIILTIFAAVSLLGCNQETITEVPDSPGAISFSNVSTRAGLSDLQANGFGVWATVSSIDSTDVSYQPILEKEHVYIPDGGTEWTYDNTQMWIPNSMFYFFAAYPYDLAIEQHSTTQNGVNYTLYGLNITADGSADTEDILVATHVTDTTADTFDPDDIVPLSFSHLLSKVNINIRQNTDIDSEFDYYVTKVTLTGIFSKATYGVLPYNDSFYQNFEPNDASAISIVKSFEDSPVQLRAKQGDAMTPITLSVWGANGLMLIPQQIVANGVQVRVDYKYDVNPEDSSLGEDKFVEGYIPPITWEPSKSYSYNLAIANSSFISFSQPSIVPWGSPQTGGTIIIK